MKNKTQLLKEKYDKQLEEVSKTYYRISKIKSKIGFASDYISYLKNEIKKQQRLIEAHCYPVFTDLFGECDGKQKFLQKKKLKKIGTSKLRNYNLFSYSFYWGNKTKPRIKL